MRRIVLALAALIVASTQADAGHCRKLSQAFAEIKKLSAQADRFEDREQMDKACAAYRKVVALKQRTLRNIPTECFHGGKKLFENSLGASQALEELACNWDDDFDDDDF